MTSISYFGKMNSTLGSVVPLAMFFYCGYNTSRAVLQHCVLTLAQFWVQRYSIDCLWDALPSQMYNCVLYKVCRRAWLCSMHASVNLCDDQEKDSPEEIFWSAGSGKYILHPGCLAHIGAHGTTTFRIVSKLKNPHKFVRLSCWWPLSSGPANFGWENSFVNI